MYPQLNIQPINTLSIQQLLPIGTVVVDDQGRKKYKYCAFGGTSTINSGLLLVAPAAPTNSTGLALSSTNTTAQLTAGSRQLIITNGATTVTANQFADGQLEVAGTGTSFSCTIAGNTADSVGNGTIIVTLAEPLRNPAVLVVGTNTVNLRQNPAYLAAASLTLAQPVGVTIMPVPNTASVTNYGWVQISGPCVAAATTAVKGQAFTQDTAGTAGFIMSTAAATSYEAGTCQENVVSGLATVKLAIE